MAIKFHFQRQLTDINLNNIICNNNFLYLNEDCAKFLNIDAYQEDMEPSSQFLPQQRLKPLSQRQQ